MADDTKTQEASAEDLEHVTRTLLVDAAKPYWVSEPAKKRYRRVAAYLERSAEQMRALEADDYEQPLAEAAKARLRQRVSAEDLAAHDAVKRQLEDSRALQRRIEDKYGLAGTAIDETRRWGKETEMRQSAPKPMPSREALKVAIKEVSPVARRTGADGRPGRGRIMGRSQLDQDTLRWVAADLRNRAEGFARDGWAITCCEFEAAARALCEEADRIDRQPTWGAGP